MYCPRCSQQQLSEEMRFCSGCGFPLSGVRELIAGGGALTTPAVPAAQPSPGQRNVRRGAWMVLASFLFGALFGLLTAIEDEFFILLFIPLLAFIIGFLRIIYGVFSADKRAAAKAAALQSNAATDQVGNAPPRELSPPRSVPIDNLVPRRVETAEMVQPASVTENTTKLLQEQADSTRESR